jgi:cystathionine beta-lyase/cystathionine gamma-synthase
MHIETQAVHAGVDIDSAYHSVATPIYATSTFYWDKLGKHRGYDYARTANPTRTALERNLAALEGGAAGAAGITATGMGAITTAMFLFNGGDHLIVSRDLYGGTYRLFTQILPRFGLSFSFVNMRDLSAVRAAIRPNTAGIWIETPSNPLLHLTDIAAIVAIARENHLRTIADNTFLSPYFQQPLKFGVDLVVHSTTKYINGHSDVIGGALIAREAELGQKVRHLVDAVGTAAGPFDAFLVLRGVKTLVPRMQAHARNALAIARFLEKHPKVKKVYYPGLESHPQRELALRQMSGFGGMLSFDLDLDQIDLDPFFAGLKVFTLAESLGGVESLIEQPWSMSHITMAESARVESGISPGTIRVSVGIEHQDDLIADLEAALGTK